VGIPALSFFDVFLIKVRLVLQRNHFENEYLLPTVLTAAICRNGQMTALVIMGISTDFHTP